MHKWTLSLTLLIPLWSWGGQGSGPVGWQWYNNTLPKKPLKHHKHTVPLNKLSPVEQVKVLQWYTQNALDKAILYPSVENSQRYMRWQRFFTTQAGAFTQSMQAMMLQDPALDYNLQYSHYNNAAPLILAYQQQKETATITRLAKTNGLFFFYRGKNALDAKLAPSVVDFAQRYHLALITVSVDGTVLPGLPDRQIDHGQNRRMGVKAFPALFLVNPVKKTYQPVAYGFISETNLAQQFLNVATHFKAEF